MNVSDKELTKLLDESEMFEAAKAKSQKEYQKQINDAIKRLKNIIEFNNAKNSKLINVFRLDSEESSQDIELTILRAFLNGFINFI